MQNAIFDEFLGLVEARVDAARAAGTLDLGVETIAVEDIAVVSDRLLRTDATSGATTHLLELDISRALKPLMLDRLDAHYDIEGPNARTARNTRSGRAGLVVPARSLLSDEGDRIARFELIRPLKHSYISATDLAESNWEMIDTATFRELWQAEVREAGATLKRERLYLATGLLLPVWDKLPSDHVRVSRIAARDGRSLLGREVPAAHVPALLKALGLDDGIPLPPHVVLDTVLTTGRSMEVRGPDTLMLKRNLVNGHQRLELGGWVPARLDWYKARGCFTEIIRFQTRLFVPLETALEVISAIFGG